MEDKNETFEYHYSATEQKEVRKIREKYALKESTEQESKMEHLRRLDKSATKPGLIASLSAGITGMLLLGVGMCCTLEWASKLFIPGIVIGVAGLLLMAAANPLYHHITKKQREKLAPEIMKLTDELMK